jgi:hypothetical protein
VGCGGDKLDAEVDAGSWDPELASTAIVACMLYFSILRKIESDDVDDEGNGQIGAGRIYREAARAMCLTRSL